MGGISASVIWWGKYGRGMRKKGENFKEKEGIGKIKGISKSKLAKGARIKTRVLEVT
jgi:hypothetical protein